MIVLTMVLTLLPATLGLAASYYSVEEFVKNVYEAGLGRAAEEEGFSYWVKELKNGRPAAEFIGYVLLDSPEFEKKYANISNEEFVKKAYEIVFNREADEKGLEFWISEMEKGGSQRYVIVAMLYADTGEFQEFCDKVGIRLGSLKVPADEYPGTEPVGLKVEEVRAINLKQVLVEYNKNIKEGSEAAKKDNYKLVDKDDEEIELSNINVNGKEVVLTIKDGQELENQSKATLTVKKAVMGEAFEEEIEFIDLTVPKVLDAKVIGEDTIKVYFSEPIAEADKDNFEINDGDYFIESVNFVNNRTEINVKTYSAFDEDTVKIEVGSGIKDFAGLSVLSKTFELEVPDDKEAPYVVEYKDASKSGVTLVFNEDIELKNDYDEEDFYHTNSKNTANDVKLNGAELKLNFKDNPLPEGKAYVYIAGETVRDLFGNVQKNVIRVAIDVEEDTTAPTIKEVKAESQSKLVVTFSEAVEDGAEKKGNYTILDSKGKEVDVIKKVEQTADDKVVITLSDDLDYGKYTLVVKGVADLSANKANDSYEFNVDDDKAPEFPEKAALYVVDKDKDEYKLVIKFDEPMAVSGQYSVLNLENYRFKGGKYFDELDDDDDIKITAKAFDENKTVEFNIKGYKVEVGDKIIMARVADAAGNRTVELQSDPIVIEKGSAIGFKSAKATARKTIVVEFDDNFKDFEKEDLQVRYGDEKLNVTKVKTLSSSKIEMTLEKNLDYTAKYDGQDVYVVVVGEKSTNKYGKTLMIGDKIKVSDNIAPALKKIEVDDEEVDYVVVDKDDKIVALYFEENIDGDTVSKVSFEVEDVKVTKAYVVDNVVYLVTDKAAAVGADVTQKAVIKDVNGNKVSDIDTEIAKEDDFDIPEQPEEPEEPEEPVDPDAVVHVDYNAVSELLPSFGKVKVEVENLDNAATFTVTYELANGQKLTTEPVPVGSESEEIFRSKTITITIYDSEGNAIHTVDHTFEE